MAETRGADILAGALARNGLRTVFSLSGNHIMSLYDAALDAGLTLLHHRQEAAAVHAAEAHARLTGECGIALVTAGQGHANAVAALATAQHNEVPLILLSGHAPLGELGRGGFQEMRQAELAAPLAKASWLVQSRANLESDLHRALDIAHGGRPGPVHLSLPTDVLEGKGEMPAPLAPWQRRASGPVLSAGTVALVRQALADAERPVIIAPPALCSPRGAPLLARLRAATGVPVVPMESPRGLNDPCLGAFAEVLAEADLVLLLGKPLDFTLRFGAGAPRARFIVLDPDPALLHRAAAGLGERLLLSAETLAAEAAAALAEAPGAASEGGWAGEVDAAIAHRPAAWDALHQTEGGPLSPVTLFRAVQPYLDAAQRPVLVCDGGEIGQWAQSLLRAPARLINGVAGAIGPSIPFALGARQAWPDATVVAVMGDGTFGFHMAEFETAVRHKLPFVAVLGNDSRWNAEHQIQLRSYGAQRAHACTLGEAIRYDLVAQALGAHAEFVERAEQLAPALERAFASGRPACVNVLVDGRAAPTVKRG